ncbi:hypothetical protein D3C83_259260 [compost metagenome]
MASFTFLSSRVTTVSLILVSGPHCVRVSPFLRFFDALPTARSRATLMHEPSVVFTGQLCCHRI